MNTRTISLVNEFSRCPGGRFTDEGDFSGQDFRESILVPALSENDCIIVDMNGASLLAPSFLDESLGMLAKRLGPIEFPKRVKYVLTDDKTALRKLEESISKRLKQWK